MVIGDTLELRIGGETPGLIDWFLMVFKIDFVAAEVALKPPLAAKGADVRGDIFCLDLGLG